MFGDRIGQVWQLPSGEIFIVTGPYNSKACAHPIFYLCHFRNAEFVSEMFFRK
jgi:hypothetical protein